MRNIATKTEMMQTMKENKTKYDEKKSKQKDKNYFVNCLKKKIKK